MDIVKPKISRKEKSQIEDWLENEMKGDLCPFTVSSKDSEYNIICQICDKLFPEVEVEKYLIKGRNPWDRCSQDLFRYSCSACPCTILGIREVERRAMEWVK